MPLPALESWRPAPNTTYCEAPCLMFKRKQQCIFIHSMHCAHVYVYVCTYTQDKHDDKVLQSSNRRLRNLATVYQTDGVSKKHAGMRNSNIKQDNCPMLSVYHMSSFFKYLTCNFDDLELGLFKVIQCQRSRCQSKAHSWFPTWPPLCLTLYLSLNGIRHTCILCGSSVTWV